MSDIGWSQAKTELNELVSELRRVHGKLPSLYSESVKGWDLAEAYEAIGYLRSAIQSLEPLTDRNHD